jgi:hypothetical protein
MKREGFFADVETLDLYLRLKRNLLDGLLRTTEAKHLNRFK